MKIGKKQEILDKLKTQHHLLSAVLVQGSFVKIIESVVEIKKASNIEPTVVYNACYAYYAENNADESHENLAKHIERKFLLDNKNAHNLILIWEFNTLCTEIMAIMAEEKAEPGNVFKYKKALREEEKLLEEFMVDVMGIGKKQSESLIKTFKNHVAAAIDEQLVGHTRSSMTR